MSNIPQIMKGIQMVGHGGPQMLKYSESIPTPTPTSNEVLIRVFAAGVNNTDINTRTAWYSKSNGDSNDAAWSGTRLEFPRIQGADVCGIIVAVGNNVDPSRIGERVIIEPCLTEAKGKRLELPWYFGSECDGGFAEYTTVSAKHAFKVNSSLSNIELASFPCSYSTAENMLTRANVVSGDRVLISGASGGVGSAAVQLAKARGAYVIAITSPSKNKQLLELGADQVIPREADLLSLFGANSVDVVIDLVAGEKWPSFINVLVQKGRYAVSGAIGGAMVELDVRTLYLKDLSFFGCTVLDVGIFANLVKLIEQGKIKPLVAHTFTLEAIDQAQEMFLKKEHVGKIVLEVTQ